LTPDAQQPNAANGLHLALGLEKRRFSVAANCIFCHYAERLQRHGNLVGMYSEGGEHVHQPPAEICECRPDTKVTHTLPRNGFIWRSWATRNLNSNRIPGHQKSVLDSRHLLHGSSTQKCAFLCCAFDERSNTQSLLHPL
jgi:hypothetical protein